MRPAVVVAAVLAAETFCAGCSPDPVGGGSPAPYSRPSEVSVMIALGQAGDEVSIDANGRDGSC
jgi:hypothetical protein